MGVVEGGQVAQRGADALVPVVRRVVVLEGNASLTRSSVRLAVLLAVRGIDGRRRVGGKTSSPHPGRHHEGGARLRPRGSNAVEASTAAATRESTAAAASSRRAGGRRGEQIPGLVVEFDAREREDLALQRRRRSRPSSCRRPLGRRSAVWAPRPRRRGGGNGEGWGRSGRIAVARGSGGGGGGGAAAEGRARRAAGADIARVRACVPSGRLQPTCEKCREFRPRRFRHS